jgi:hypothetical protein
MKKNASDTMEGKAKEKGIFYQAGEIIGSIGFHIVNGKDKLVGVVSDEFKTAKKVIKRKLGKKKTSLSKSKKVSKNASPGKIGKKITRKITKHTKKDLPVKTARKEAGQVKEVAKKKTKKD